MKEAEIYVLYHDPCPDGFAAALAAYRRLGEKAVYLPVQYGEEPPEMADGATVYIVDFSYRREVLRELAERMARVVVIDHHKTARDDLTGWDDCPENVDLRFDMSRSGAVLAWQFFFPEYAVPILLSYVEDRDLWKWELPDSREVAAGLRLVRREFSEWMRHLRGVEKLVQTGAVALQAQQIAVRGICKNAFSVEIDGHAVPCVNTSAFHSECCERLKELNPEAPFVASYFDDGSRRRWSLRSGPAFDAGALARKLGGGGHPQAAGFEEPMPAAQPMLKDKGDLLRK